MDSRVATKRVPSRMPLAPSASAATRPRPSAIPPAATTGTRTASTTCGTSTIVPTLALSGDAGLPSTERWPPASPPSATMTAAQAAVQPQVHAERPVGQLAHPAHRLLKIAGGHVQSGQDSKAARAAHLRHQLGTGHATHARLEDRVLDAEQRAETRPQAHDLPPRSSSAIACSRRRPRCTLSPWGPEVRGTSFTKRIRRGILNEAIFPRQKSAKAVSVTRAPSFTMT